MEEQSIMNKLPIRLLKSSKAQGSAALIWFLKYLITDHGLDVNYAAAGGVILGVAYMITNAVEDFAKHKAAGQELNVNFDPDLQALLEELEVEEE